MPYAVCPGCDQSVYVPKEGSRLRVGDVIRCDACEAELEVISVSPLELDFHEYESDEEGEEDE